MNYKFIILKFITILFFLTADHKATAQEKNKVSFSEKLNELENKFNVNFSYNHTFFKYINVNNTPCKTLQQCLAEVEKQIPIDYQIDKNGNYHLTPQRKNIQLKIIDQETLQSIPILEFSVNNGSTKRCFKNRNELFTLENIFPLDSILINSYSYKNLKIAAKDLLKNETLKLSKRTFHLNEIVLRSYITSGIDSKISDHSIQINTKSLGLLAGETDGDLLNVLKNIPGVYSPSGKPGNLNFRGNTYDQNLILIDDIPIYHSGHFLGAISPYNTSIITDVEVHRNTLPAQWGGRVGGLINMTTDPKITDHNQYNIAINSLYAGATIKTNLIKDKLSFLLSARSNYPNFQSPKLQAISTLIFQGSRLESVAEEVNESDDFIMGFWDMNAKLNYKINKKNTATLSFINIQNNLSAKINENNNDEIDYRELELDNWGITGKWEAHVTDKLNTTLRISRSKMNLISESEGFTSTERSSFQKYDNTITDSRIITEAVYKPNDNSTLKTGYTFTEHQLTSNEEEQENNLDAKRTQTAIIHSAYLSVEKNWKDKLILNLGIYNNYYAPLQKIYLNPRIFSSYAFNQNLYLKSSIGSSNQFIQKKFTDDFDDFNITNQLWYLPNDEISPLKGIQTMLGGVFNKKRWLIDLEMYYKKTNNITNKTDDVQGTLSSLGVDLFVKKRWNRFQAWISYSLSNATTDFNKLNTYAFFDQTHILNLTQILNLKKWKFALSWNYSTGMPVVYANETNNTTINTINSDRFKSLHQLDFSTSYTFHNTLKNVKTVVGLSVLNVYDQENTVNIFQNSSDNSLRTTTGIAPNLQISLFF